ncbi:Rieske 2Fe-2S domain-containing protein [Rhodoluna sp.]|uniref:cytochrome bc1 complex Rieske iron-sulfur subunit n=1 Tax=Rhodoluna sp. TaxID=1969481 RepID=UPI0025FA39EA|nr:Rieske 2Fe-2S domain-containing protein [Rhodoluna sp.]
MSKTNSPDAEHDYSGGLAVIAADKIQDPGLEPHRVRMTDKSKKHEKAASRQVTAMFVASAIGSAFAIYAYFAFPLTDDLGSVRNNTVLLGLGITLGLLGIGIGAVHWAKTLMPDNEVSEPRHQTRGSEEVRARAIEIIKLADSESGFSRRKLIRRSLYGALALFPLPAIMLFGDLGPNPGDTLRHTMWKKGTRLAKDPTGTPIKASDVTIGSVFHVIPEGLADLEHHKLEEKAKAAVLLVRLDPADIKESEERKTWSYDGIVAYSKICTHVGCPVALYEQHTHHLLCPCHQSTFDVTDACKVVFGPASRPLPQLPITVDAEGYLIAQSDFTEPVGPSFWER